MTSADGPKIVAPGLLAERSGQVHTWWLDNEARRNAVTPGALRWIAQRCASLRGETIVLRGAGGRAFCAGFALTALAEPAPAGQMPDAPLIAATTAIRTADATFVAVLDGYAIGAGVELCCACDLRIAQEGVFFAIPAAELGVVYHADGLANIRTVMGPAIARRLLLLGDRVDANDAWSAGALVRLVPSDDIEATLADVLGRLQSGAPLSVGGNRDLLRSLDRGALSEAARLEHDERRRTAYASEDHKEARVARSQRRSPRFKGR